MIPSLQLTWSTAKICKHFGTKRTCWSWPTHASRAHRVSVLETWADRTQGHASTGFNQVLGRGEHKLTENQPWSHLHVCSARPSNKTVAAVGSFSHFWQTPGIQGQRYLVALGIQSFGYMTQRRQPSSWCISGERSSHQEALVIHVLLSAAISPARQGLQWNAEAWRGNHCLGIQ